MARCLFWSGLSSGLLALSACGSNSDVSAPAVDTTVDATAAAECAKYYAAQCKQAYECLTATERANATVNLGTSEASCKTTLPLEIECSRLTFCAEGSKFDPGKSQECLGAIAALSCDDYKAAQTVDACSNLCVDDPAIPGDGTMDATTECEKYFHAQCKQIYACLTQAAIAADAADYGATAAECENIRLTKFECACSTDQTFDGAQADACAIDTGALTCDEFLSGAPPTSCSSVCK